MPDQPGDERDLIWSGRERGPRWTPRPRLLALLALVVLAAAVVVVVAAHAVPRRAGTRGPRGPGGPVQVTDVWHPLLAVRAAWELFGLGPGQVVRIQLARGRITWTAFPGLLSSGPVTLLAGPHQARRRGGRSYGWNPPSIQSRKSWILASGHGLSPL